jgi:ssDNA thymidine ADP-ribosyltransferase, DarT
VSDECIHGFVDGLCATCNPKPVPEAIAPIRTTTRSRTTTATRPTVRGLRAAARVPAGASQAINLLEQRIYHITHISNLAAILAGGALEAGAEPVLELSPVELRSESADIVIPGDEHSTLAHYVPFFLSPEASLWQSLRAGSKHPRLSSGALAADPLDFVFLVTTLRSIASTDTAFVVADSNSDGPATRFARTREDAERMLQRLHADSTGETIQGAEVLVSQRVPFEDVTLIGVANDRVRQSVRDLLAEADFTPKVSVYPPWFQQSE